MLKKARNLYIIRLEKALQRFIEAEKYTDGTLDIFFRLYLSTKSNKTIPLGVWNCKMLYISIADIFIIILSRLCPFLEKIAYIPDNHPC